MRVLHVADRLSERGGADWHVLGVVRELAQNAEMHLAVGRDEVPGTLPCPVTVVAGMDAGEATAADDLELLARRLSPDVIHLHNCMSPAVLDWGVTRDAILTVQDHRVFCPGRGKLTLAGRACRDPMARLVCAACFTDREYFERIHDVTRRRLDAVRRMRAVVVLSRYMRDELIAAGVDATRISVIPPFVHGLDPAAAPDGPPCVLFVGRLVAAKGVRDAVEAHRRSGVTLPLVFAGSGPERARLEAAGCEVLGWVSHARLASVYRRAQVVVMPSRWQEPFGLVGLEALTMGVPVVAWDSGGVGEWHCSVTAWGDVDGLGQALRVACGGTARVPEGFECAVLMSQLRGLYDRAGGSRTAGSRGQ